MAYTKALPALWPGGGSPGYTDIGSGLLMDYMPEVPYAPPPALAPSGGALTATPPPNTEPSPLENILGIGQSVMPMLAAGLAGGPAGLLIALAAGSAAGAYRNQKQSERNREIERYNAEIQAQKAEAEARRPSGKVVGKSLVDENPDSPTYGQVIYSEADAPSDFFEGTGIEAQALNRYLNSLPEDQRQAEADRLAKERLIRATTITTPAGTEIRPGYSFPGMSSTEPTTVPPRPTQRERSAEFVVGNLDNLETRIQDAESRFDPTSVQSMAADIPLVGNFLASGAQQEHRAAADEWTTNMVFLRSGATAREDEKESTYQNYFAQPGDAPETVINKRAMRAEARAEAEKQGREAGRLGPSETPTVTPTVTTQAEYDALPSGAEFIEDGKRYRKP